ncbi:MAG: hypothetical protein AAGC71_14160 [Pseudomonadota bacterium]
MTNENPYQPPESDLSTGVGAGGLNEKTFNHLAQGQKMAIYAIVIYFIAAMSVSSIGGIAGLLVILALILALIGLVRILLGSEIGWFAKVLLFVAMFIPLINLLALARTNHIATKELRAAGYKVGFLGVKGGYSA